MATLMQKDVLLEYIASKIAKANINNQLEIMESLKDIREFLYKSSCEDIDYEDSIAKIKQISLESETC